MRAARVAAQAKVNLWLKVGARDQSGYHEIGTIFHRIDLADVVVVRVGGRSRTIDVQGPAVPPGGLGATEKNLAWRAAVAYADRTGWPNGFAIELTKHIPVGGGLGGGSADAGAVLRALNALAEQPLDERTLRGMAEQLGADVAFLASEHAAAVAGGRGEQLMPFAPLPVRPVLLVVPNFAIGTADAYRWLDEARANEEPRTLTDHVSLQMLTRWDLMAQFSENEFEPVIERRHPDIRRYRERLESAGALIARMSGSGSAVFGVFEGELPALEDFAAEASVVRTATSARVVQVEARE